MAYSQYKTTTSSGKTIYFGSGSGTSTNAAKEGAAARAQYARGGGSGGSAQIIEVVSAQEEAKRNAATQKQLEDFKKLETANAAKGIYVTGMEKIKNPENTIKLLNANVSGDLNNQMSRVNPADLNKTKYPTNFSERGQAIADIRAGKYEGIVVKNGVIQYADGSGRVGVYGGQVYDVKTKELITPAKAKLIARGETTFEKATKLSPSNEKLIGEANKASTVMILTDESGKATGVEYGAKSYTTTEFKNAYGVKVLQDPKDNSFFFGTVGTPDKAIIKSISGEVKPITDKERKQVQNALLKSNIKILVGGQVGLISALEDSSVGKYLKKESTWAYDKITSVTTAKLSKYAEQAKANAVDVLNQSDFKTGNKLIDTTAKSLGYVSYFGGSAGAYGLNMLSGLGNVALGLALKPKQTVPTLILAAPAMIKNSYFELGRTLKGRGTIEDFFGSALTLATLGQTTAGFSKYGASLKNIKMTRQLKKDLPAIKQAVAQSQRLLKTQQNFFQRVFTQNSKKWTTFGKSVQEMNGMNAKHGWFSITNGKKSTIIQKSIIENKNVRMINFMSAQSTTNKISKFLVGMRDKFGNKFALGERYYNNKKLGTYFSSTKARRDYTFIQNKKSPYTIAIDGKGNTFVLKNRAELLNFIKNAKFGKMKFTGRRFIGGNIDSVMQINKRFGIGTGQKSNLGFSNTRGLTFVQKAIKMEVPKNIGTRAKPISKVFRQTKELSMAEWRASVDKAVKSLDRFGNKNPEKIRALVKDLNKVYKPKTMSMADFRKSTDLARRNLDNYLKANPNKLRSFVKDKNKIYKNEGMSMAEWRRTTAQAGKNLDKWAKENPKQLKSLVRDLNKVYKPKEMSIAEWRASIQKAVENLNKFGRENPDKIRALAKDFKKVYTSKEPTNLQMSRIYNKNIKNLNSWAKSNPKKIKSFVDDIKKISGNRQQLEAVTKQTSLPKNVLISKNIKNSVVSSQLKNVAKSISRTIAKNDLALKTGFRAVVGASGLMFFTNTGKLVSGKDATKLSGKSINKTIDAVRDIIKNNTKQNPSFRVNNSQRDAQKPAQRSSEKSQLQSKQIQRQSSGQRSSFRSNFNFKPAVKTPNLSSGSKKNLNIVKSILGNKLAPSYRIVIGSGKKVKTLNGRFTPAEAISKGAYTIDRTKERTVRIVPTKQRPNSKFKMNYLREAGSRFRNYRIKQGKAVRFSSTRLIEKRKFFNNFKGEVRRKR